MAKPIPSENCKFLDLAGAAIRTLRENAAAPLERQVDIWYEHYHQRAPELVRKCIRSYESESQD